jgi:hypothetical protein
MGVILFTSKQFNTDLVKGLDIWASGVILLSLLLRQFPLFASNDDVDALNEIAIIFGTLSINAMACRYGNIDHSAPGQLTDFARSHLSN